jgi:predicted transcriptional regulator
MTEPGIPRAERDVLASLHRDGEATARQLRERLEAYRPMSHGAMLTLLKRLEGKAMVTKEKGPVGKAHVYRAAGRRASTFGGLVRDLLQGVFHGDGVALVASLFETKPPNREEVKQLEQMLAEIRRRQNEPRSKP